VKFPAKMLNGLCDPATVTEIVCDSAADAVARKAHNRSFIIRQAVLWARYDGLGY
jgi:hypothetical protein